MSFRTEYARNYGNLIGSGAFRDVFRTTHGKYVYKFDSGRWGHGRGSNAYEFETYQYITKHVTLPAGVYIPAMWYVDKVIISEYIEGRFPDTPCNSFYHVEYCKSKKNCWYTKVSQAPINDIKDDNVLITPDGKSYIIDLGNGSSHLTSSEDY